MKIAYILYPDVIISNRSNGIRSQAVTWAELLRKAGHTVDNIDNWGDYDWKSYDIIHLFGGGKWIYNVSKRLSEINANIVWSPIADPPLGKANYYKFSLLRNIQKIANNKFQWGGYETIMSIPYFKLILTRTNFEGKFLTESFGIPKEKIYEVPLSYSTSCHSYEKVPKEPFCLHISSIYQERKNVIRLIEAAKKYNFNLVLAGNKGSESQYKKIRDTISDNTNIKVLGFISEEEKISLYKRAKVFALPSISEGVGIVALEAAYYGCEIVITNIPGPKEYYKGKATEIDPLSIDSIGKGIIEVLTSSKFQPELSYIIEREYSEDSIRKKLLSSYELIK